MAKWQDSLITNDGLDMLVQLLNGGTLTITRAALGSGTVDTAALIRQTSLTAPILVEAKIAQKNVISGAGVDVKIRITNSGVTTAQTMRQVGVFAKLESGEEKLFAIMQDTVGEEIPTAAEYPEFLLEFTSAIAVSNTDNIVVQISNTFFVTYEDLENALKGYSKIGHTHAAATQSAAGMLSAADKKKLDGIAEGANKTVVDTALSEMSTNPVQNKAVNAALAEKANKSDIPTALPADGGNADTLDGKHADDLYYSHYPAETDANNCVANGNYMLMPSAANLPISAYILIAADTSADGTWLMQRAVDVVNPASHYMRLKVNGVWSAWRLIADGGNADTLDGKHAEEFKIFSFIENGAGVTCIEAAQDANNLVRLQIQTNMEIARLFKSTDGGASWTELPLGNAAGVGGYGISDTGKAGIPTITSDYGVMEVGTYIDFHSGNDGKDYNVRIQTGSSGDEKLYVSSSTGLGTVVANLQGNASTADYATNANFSSTLQASCGNVCLRNISTGSAAASTKTLALGEMYGQYE